MSTVVGSRPIQRALCGLAFLFVANAQAVVLVPGSGATLAGTTPPTAQLLAQQELPFELLAGASTLATGHVSQSVLREDGSGLLRFEYRLFVDAASPGPVQFVSPASFASFSTDVDYVAGSAGDVAPGGATRSPNAIFVSYFPGTVAAGQSTVTMFVRTDAMAYDSGGWVRLQQGSALVDSFGAYQPAVVVPEPATAALWFTGLALLWLLRRQG